MKLLLDIPFSRSTTVELAAAGHDVIYAADLLPPDASDEEIVRLALAEGRVILCFDLDFGAIVASSGRQRPSVVTLRTSRHSPSFVTPLLLRVLPTIEPHLAAGCLVSVEDGRTRLRVLPVGGERTEERQG